MKHLLLSLLIAALVLQLAHAQTTPRDVRQVLELMEYRTVVCMEGAASQALRVNMPQPSARRYVLRQCSGPLAETLKAYKIGELAIEKYLDNLAERAVRYTYF